MSFEGEVIGWGATHRRHHAFAGWPGDPHSPDRYGTSLAGQFPALCALSLALPFGAAWLIGDTWRAALAGLLWAGLVRVAVLQHVTWSVNSLCHVFGSRPFASGRFDRATNLWPLSSVSFGASWHNMLHSDPACARHGAEPGLSDIAAGLIRVFDRLGWATRVHWPVPGRLAARRRNRGRDQPQPALQPGRRRTRRAVADRLSPPPTGSDRLA